MRGTTTRRMVALTAAAAAGLLAFTACAPAAADKDGDIVTDGSFKVGFIAPLTGVVAVAGQEMQQGWDLYWEMNGTKVGDIEVDTVVEDDAGNPDVSLTKAKRLVEQEQVDLVVGPLLANTALAVAAYTAEAGVPNMHPVSAADDLTQRLRNDLTMRVGAMAGSQMNFPAGAWALEQGHKTAATLCPDYAFGWESCAGFARTFTEGGGKILDQAWYPLGTQDFSSYVSQLQNAGADIVFLTTAGGADGPNILKTFNNFGLKDKQPLLTNCCAMDQATLRGMGEEVAGITSVSYYAEGLDDPAVQEFVEGFEKKHDAIPSLNVAGGYVTAMVVAEVLKKTKGKVSGAEFIKAARELSYPDSPYGPIEFDEYNNLVAPIYIRKAEQRADGSWWNVPIKTYPAVSQFWTWDPEEYLKGDTYSRDNNGDVSKR